MPTTNLEQVLAILPPEIRQALAQFEPNHSIEELRLRAGLPCTILRAGREEPLLLCGMPLPVTSSMLQKLVAAATHQSRYAAEEAIAAGYLTLQGGHRLGLCGNAVMQNGIIQSIRTFSSVSIRIGRQFLSVAEPLLPALREGKSLLLAGPPGCGKTTLLRDAVRLLSDKLDQRVGLCDERGEIAAVWEGVPQFAVGRHTDVLTGCGKGQAVNMLVRTMNPQWIAVDEITQPNDVEAMTQVSYCGVRFLATAHANSPRDLLARPVYQQLLESRLFQAFAFLSAEKHLRLVEEEEVYGSSLGSGPAWHRSGNSRLHAGQKDHSGVSYSAAAL